MNYQVSIEVFLKDGVFDPAADTTLNSLNRLEMRNIAKLRMGKMLNLTIDAASKDEAISTAEKACETLLVNPVMEKYQISVKE
mgnify:FL=1